MIIVVVGVFLLGLANLLARFPIPTLAFGVILTIATAVVNRARRIQLRRLARNRAGETICDFARSFDLHDVDPWIVRAVYEQLQANLAPDHPGFPIRASDRLRGDLRIADDTLSMDLAEEIAQRCDRELTSPQAKDSSVPVDSVADLVFFFNRLPSGRAT